MPFTSGTYSLPTGNPVVPGTTISSTTTNTTNSDIATALSACLLKDGTQTVTANIPMASHKFTGLSAGTTAGDSVEFAGSPSFTNLAYTGTLTGSTGILNIGSGQLYKDASGNMGIGTSSPSADTAVTIFNSGTALNGTGLLVRSGYPGYSGNVANILSLRDKDNTTDTFNIKTDGSLSLNHFSTFGTYTNSLTVNASGNVGIGTSSPTSKLTVGTPFAQTPGITASFSSATPTFASGQGTVSIGSTDAVAVDKGGVLTFNANTTPLSGFPVSAIAGKVEAVGAGIYSGYLQFITSSSAGATLERMRIDSSGNMGIGTSSPGAKLQVTSATNIVGIINSTSATNTSLLTFTDPSTTLSSGLGPVIGSAGNNLIFGRGGVSEYMRIDSSGNMGIGTSSPSTKLTVAGAITITGAFGLRGSYGAGAITSNFAAGDNALAYNTTGIQNTASGMAALQNNTTGSYNTASGYQALLSNTTGTQNTASGMNALVTNTTGIQNTASGVAALQNNTTGGQNTASGVGALQLNTTGSNNTASGYQALLSNTTGTQNTASGMNALQNNTTGNYNTASGQAALQNNTTGNYNTASGVGALLINTTGIQNTASGVNALLNNTTGNYNTASGLSALQNNTTGAQNTASGVSALQLNTTGNYNTASGYQALLSNTTGSGNSAFNPLTSAGTFAPVFNPTVENDRFCMGSTGVTNAYIQVAWTVVSDARDKTNFAPVPHGLDFVNQLQPTAYQFKEDRETDVATGIVRYGFKAQDILALEGDNPVIIDTEDLDKLRFNSDSLIPVLVNAIQELTARLQILEAK